MKKILYLLLLTAIFSCSKIVEIDMPVEDKQAVVNCLLTPDSTIEVNLSKSLHVFDSCPEFINNAIVELYENNNFIENLNLKDSGNYFSSTLQPTENSIYKVQIATPEFENVWAVDTIPQKVLIDNISTTGMIGVNASGKSFAELTLKFKDTEFVNNYFEVFIIHKYISSFIMPEDEIVRSGTVWFCNDIIITEENEDAANTDGNWGSLIFSDKYFKNKTCTLKINYFPEIGFSMDGVDEIAEDYTIFVVLNSISKQYYDFLKKLRLNDTYFNLWETSEEVCISGNVNNGLGIFAGYSSDIDTLFWQY